ncbi:hypothetical protein D910_12134 [Dendroctonus ponderosae]
MQDQTITCLNLTEKMIPIHTTYFIGYYTQKAGQVIALIQNRLSQRAVARQLDMTRAAVRRVCKRYEETRSFHRRAGTGRRRFTTARDDRFIVSTTLRNRHFNAVQVQRQLREVRGEAISQWTVRRRLQENNLTPKTPCDWSKTYSSSSASTPASEFDVGTMGICSVLRRKGHRRPRERFADCCFEEQSYYEGSSCMIWGATSIGARTDPEFIRRGDRVHRRRLAAVRYIEEILAIHVVPYVDYIGDEFTFMPDNARPHTARIGIKLMNINLVSEVGRPLT